MSTDLELLEAWRSGDNAAGEALVERHMRVLYRFLRNKVDRNVDELIQRTWLNCVESRDSFRGESSFRTYLLGIARHQLLSHYRRAKRDQAIDFCSASAVDLGTSATGRLAKQQEHLLLLRALRSIPLDYQVALELFYWEDLTGAELAKVLGIGENTVRSRINRARAALGVRLEELADDPAVLETTTSDLATWAASLREYVDADAASMR